MTYFKKEETKKQVVECIMNTYIQIKNVNDKRTIRFIESKIRSRHMKCQ